MANKQSGISYAEALRLLELPSNFNKEQLHKNWRKLALKHHPDLAAQYKDSIEERVLMMKRINEAASVLRTQPSSQKVISSDVKPYLMLLQRRAPIGTTPEQLDGIYANIVKQKRFAKDENTEKLLSEAYNVLRNNYTSMESVLARGRVTVMKAMRRRARYYSAPPEEKIQIIMEQRKLQEDRDKLANLWLNRLNQLVTRSRYKKGKPHVPIVVRPRQGRPYVKIILLSAAIIIAILGGKYVWNLALKAYQARPLPPKLLT